MEGQLSPTPNNNSPNSCISHFYLTEKVALAVQILKNQNAFKKREEKLGEGPQPHWGGSRGQLNSTPAPSVPEHLTQAPPLPGT